MIINERFTPPNDARSLACVIVARLPRPQRRPLLHSRMCVHVRHLHDLVELRVVAARAMASEKGNCRGNADEKTLQQLNVPEIVLLNAIGTFVANVKTKVCEMRPGVKGSSRRRNDPHLTLSEVRTDCNCREWLIYINEPTCTQRQEPLQAAKHAAHDVGVRRVPLTAPRLQFRPANMS